ncbi:MAG TPA: rod shape-determining protein MreD [Candidatus Limnocylindrales bacterium]|jgi:rod shape-determining protein MreD|nr:rod shape-determining protein MreD [Candidatus Limnocylindrales bacterium]
MSIPFAAVGAVLAALIETSVLPQLAVAGIRPDLVFVLAIVATMTIGVEDGLTWAFLGGIMLDLLVPERRLGMTALLLLILAGIAIAMARLLPGRRVAVVGAAVFVLSICYQVLVIESLAAFTGTTSTLEAGSIVPTAVLDLIIGLLAAAAGRWLWLRFGQQDRIEW